ncbi:MAG: low affinity iron permease family protein [Caulobacteraceae bacterium]|nr:low affinity iron permease family protein [Caulobacteraceae bacterium]
MQLKAINRAFSGAANTVATITGRPYTFALCVGTVIIWAISGPVFKFSDTWQLVINTGTTIITFLMVFLIQNTQNRETAAMQCKLDEIIYAIRGAQNRMIGIEHLTDEELEQLVREAEARAAVPAGKRTDRHFGAADGAKAGSGARRSAAASRKPSAPARSKAASGKRK